MKALIQKLVETFSPSGYEEAIRDIIRAAVAPFADEIRVDALGNLIVRKGKQAKGGKRIMLAGHMDEIGLIASHIDEKGFVRFSTLGGIRPQVLYGARVVFVNGVQGVIGGEKLESWSQLHAYDKMFIDVGASSPKDCPVKVGDVAAFERTFIEVGDKLVAKAMDDRIGCAVMIETLRQLKSSPHEIYFVFTTQEEVNISGAATAAFGIEPEIGIALDVTSTGDTPKSATMAVALGKGPAIKIKDSGMIADARIVDWMIRTAEKAKLPYQREVLIGGTTDAKAIQVSRAGVPAGCISIPCRYIHTPSEMIDLNDVNHAVQLLLAMLEKPVDI